MALADWHGGLWLVCVSRVMIDLYRLTDYGSLRKDGGLLCTILVYVRNMRALGGYILCIFGQLGDAPQYGHRVFAAKT